jgi:Flp pilus assembly pilin Flp
MKNLIKRFVREEEGQDLAEYALLLLFIAIACIAAVTALGPIIAGVYNQIAGAL